MFKVGDIIIRVKHSYDKVYLGTQGRVIKRKNSATASRVRILNGLRIGEEHVWSDHYVKLLEAARSGTPDWEV